MKKILICICILSLALTTFGCDSQYTKNTESPLAGIEIKPTGNVTDGVETALPLQTAIATETLTPLDNTTTTSTKAKDNICLTVDSKRINLYFDMTMEAAINMLSNEEINYKKKNDTSYFRSWSGHRLVTPAFDLIFDLQGLLHEIFIKEKIESDLPIMIDDLVVDMHAKLGEPSCDLGIAASVYNEYAIDSYYLRAVYYVERIPFDEYIINEIIISKYSTEQYKEIGDPATLILTNKNGDKADFFIGMKIDAVKAQLDMLDLRYSINNGVMSGESYDYLPEDAPPDGYSFELHFNSRGYVSALTIYGPGAMTDQGLQCGDTEERMVELHGNDYIKKEFDYDYLNEYEYVCGDNYLNISTDSSLDPAAPVSIIEITRYT